MPRKSTAPTSTEPRGSNRGYRAALAIVVTSVLLAGCGEANRDRVDRNSVVGSGSTLFPDGSLQDWVSYADHIVVYSVVKEREMPLDEEEREIGEGYAGKVATLEVDRTLWSAETAPPLPNQIEMEAIGSVFRDGERQRTVARDAPNVAVGDKYLAPIAQVEFEVGPEWWPLTPGAQLPVQDGRVARASWTSPSGEPLVGRTLDDVQSIVRRQPPDPVALKHMNLRPQDRVKTVYQEKERQPPP
jgi:hypothetical protein